MFQPKSFTTNSLLVGFATLALALTTGCGVNLSEPVATTLPSFGGVLHGGQSPIQGATVNLYVTKAAATGYGQAATLISTATSDVNGNFTFPTSASSSNCPAGQQAYITAAGGYPSGNSALVNTSSLMLDALGDCKNITSSTLVVVNELTSVAAAYALSGFMTTSASGSLYTANVSAPVANNSPTATPTSAAPAGLAHAFLNAAALVNPLIGQANATESASFNGTTFSGSVPLVELNTLGDIMQACVDSATGSTGCTSLFGFTPSISGTAPLNTLQSFINLARNPYPSAAAMSTSTGLLSLATATSAFQPTLVAAPNDWSMAVSFRTFPAGTYWMALDANDTVYLGLSTTSTTAPAIYGLSVYGNTVPAFGSPTVGTATRGIAADNLGNIWVVTNSTGLYSFSATAGGAPTPYTTLGSAYNLAVDKANNVWVAHVIGSSTNMDEFAYNTTTKTWAVNYTAQFPGGLYGVAIDANQNIWGAPYYCGTLVSGACPGTSGTNTQVAVLANTGTVASPTYVSSGTAITPVAATLNGASAPYNLVFDASGNAWYDIYGGATAATSGIEEVIPTLTSTTITSITPQPLINGTVAGTGSTSGNTTGWSVTNVPAIDGAGTMFLPDNSGTQDFHMYSTTTGKVISPTAGILGCYLAAASTTTCGTKGSGAAVYNSRSPVVDSTGSVWAGYTTGGVTELIGLAAPSYPVLAAGNPGLSPGLTAVNPLP